MIREYDLQGHLIAQWDDSTRLYTTWNASGVQTGQRAYNAAENLAADARATRDSATANGTTIGNAITNTDLPAMQAILDDTNANINTNPAQRIKDTARAIRRLDRKVQNLLDGTT